MFKGTKSTEKKESKKRKMQEEDEVGPAFKQAKVEEEPSKKFDWIDCALEVLSKKGSTKMKKLKKKVISEYLSHFPDTVKTQVELSAKFEKKLQKSKKLKINNDIVSVSTSRE